MKQALVGTALVSFFAIPAPAQGSAEVCGPPLTVAAMAFPGLDSLSLGVQEVGQLFVIPNPGVGTDRFLGAFTGVPTNQTDYDFGMFTWTPGTPPTSRPFPPRFFWRRVTPIWAARRPATSLIGASTGKEPSGCRIVS